MLLPFLSSARSPAEVESELLETEARAEPAPRCHQPPETSTPWLFRVAGLGARPAGSQPRKNTPQIRAGTCARHPGHSHSPRIVAAAKVRLLALELIAKPREGFGAPAKDKPWSYFFTQCS